MPPNFGQQVEKMDNINRLVCVKMDGMKLNAKNQFSFQK